MSVLIEFTTDTEKRKTGDRLRVDEGSAKSFEKKQVAKRVDEAAEAAAADAPAPAGRASKASAPAPAGGAE